MNTSDTVEFDGLDMGDWRTLDAMRLIRTSLAVRAGHATDPRHWIGTGIVGPDDGYGWTADPLDGCPWSSEPCTDPSEEAFRLIVARLRRTDPLDGLDSVLPAGMGSSVIGADETRQLRLASDGGWDDAADTWADRHIDDTLAPTPVKADGWRLTARSSARKFRTNHRAAEVVDVAHDGETQYRGERVGEVRPMTITTTVPARSTVVYGRGQRMPAPAPAWHQPHWADDDETLQSWKVTYVAHDVDTVVDVPAESFSVKRTSVGTACEHWMPENATPMRALRTMAERQVVPAAAQAVLDSIGHRWVRGFTSNPAAGRQGMASEVGERAMSRETVAGTRGSVKRGPRKGEQAPVNGLAGMARLAVLTVEDMAQVAALQAEVKRAAATAPSETREARAARKRASRAARTPEQIGMAKAKEAERGRIRRAAERAAKERGTLQPVHNEEVSA